MQTDLKQSARTPWLHLRSCSWELYEKVYSTYLEGSFPTCHPCQSLTLLHTKASTPNLWCICNVSFLWTWKETRSICHSWLSMGKLQNTESILLSLLVKNDRNMKFFCWVKKGKIRVPRGLGSTGRLYATRVKGGGTRCRKKGIVKRKIRSYNKHAFIIFSVALT